MLIVYLFSASNKFNCKSLDFCSMSDLPFSWEGETTTFKVAEKSSILLFLFGYA